MFEEARYFFGSETLNITFPVGQMFWFCRFISSGSRGSASCLHCLLMLLSPCKDLPWGAGDLIAFYELISISKSGKKLKHRCYYAIYLPIHSKNLRYLLCIELCVRLRQSLSTDLRKHAKDVQSGLGCTSQSHTSWSVNPEPLYLGTQTLWTSTEFMKLLSESTLFNKTFCDDGNVSYLLCQWASEI